MYIKKSYTLFWRYQSFTSCKRKSEPAKMSGGDLDGDEFLCSIYEPLVNSITQIEPLKYESGPCLFHFKPENTKIDDAKDWFVEKLFSGDSLGKISNCHYALCDNPDFGPNHENCKSLSLLRSRALDSPKTGDYVMVPKEIYETYQEPNFLGGKYESPGILGKLYVNLMRRIKELGQEQPYQTNYIDNDLVVPGHEKYLAEAITLRDEYNIEFRSMLDKKLTLEDAEARLHESNLKEYFITKFYNDELVIASDDEKKKKASAWYVATYRDNFTHTSRSFPWLISEWLNRIKADKMSQNNNGKIGNTISNVGTSNLDLSIL